MEIIYLLIPLSLVLLGVACYAFFWAVKHNQFDDMDTPAREILQNDHAIEKQSNSSQQRVTPKK